MKFVVGVTKEKIKRLDVNSACSREHSLFSIHNNEDKCGSKHIKVPINQSNVLSQNDIF